jgi:hypothetical protein
MVSTVRWSCIGRAGQTATFRFMYDLLAAASAFAYCHSRLKLYQRNETLRRLALAHGWQDNHISRHLMSYERPAIEERIKPATFRENPVCL